MDFYQQDTHRTDMQRYCKVLKIWYTPFVAPCFCFSCKDEKVKVWVSRGKFMK